MGWLAAPQALDVGGNGLIIFGAIAVIVLLCAGVGVNAWLRVRRIDRAAETAEAEEPAETKTTPAPADDFVSDPNYQGPGDWDGGPLDPPEFRTTPG